MRTPSFQPPVPDASNGWHRRRHGFRGGCLAGVLVIWLGSFLLPQLNPGQSDGARFGLTAPARFPGSHPAEAAPAEPGRFLGLEVHVDARGQPLAAYQVEVIASQGTVQIVGIEGGEHPAFRDPPFYDPRAMQRERVILAAFSTAAPEELPSGRTRVATIHCLVSGAVEPVFAVKLQAAASAGARKIKATATVEERKQE